MLYITIHISKVAFLTFLSLCLKRRHVPANSQCSITTWKQWMDTQNRNTDTDTRGT